MRSISIRGDGYKVHQAARLYVEMARRLNHIWCKAVTLGREPGFPRPQRPWRSAPPCAPAILPRRPPSRAVQPARRRPPVLLLCDHAGRHVPPELEQLGLSDEALARHIGWDIGAADLTRELARLLDAPAILNHMSRLVIDPNRRPGTPTSIPEISDGCVVPGNQGLDAGGPGRARAAATSCPTTAPSPAASPPSAAPASVPAVIAIHSFTPRMNGEDRPWQVGVLWRGDRRLSRHRCWRRWRRAAISSSATTSPTPACATSASPCSSTPSAPACRTSCSRSARTRSPPRTMPCATREIVHEALREPLARPGALPAVRRRQSRPRRRPDLLAARDVGGSPLA